MDVDKRNELGKMRAYGDRIVQVEKGSFVPLVYTTTSEMEKQCVRTHKRIAELVAGRKSEKYADVIDHVRTRVRFSLLKSILIAIRGATGKGSRSWKQIMEANAPAELWLE